MRKHLVAAFRAGIAAVDPVAAVEASLTYRDRTITVANTVVGAFEPSHIVVIGIGKAAGPMADAVVSVTGATRGIVVTPYPTGGLLPTVVGGHPLPTRSSLEAGAAVAATAASVSPDDCVIAVVSGGGSAALETPADGVSLADLVVMHDVLINSGAPIEDINEVRAAVSGLKAGGLRSMLDTDVIATLVLSDIAVGGPHLVSSGPTIPSDLGGRASAVVGAYGLAEKLPWTVLQAVPKSTRHRDRRESDIVVEIGSPRSAALAAASALRSFGYTVAVPDKPLTGETTEAVTSLLAEAEGSLVVRGGETTLAVTGDGVGGRNQHAALVAAKVLAGSSGSFCAIGTDGIDGNTAAAGAIVDGTSAARAAAAGFDVSDHLARFDSSPLLDAIGDTVVTGPTGTNVADLWIAKGPGTGTGSTAPVTV